MSKQKFDYYKSSLRQNQNPMPPNAQRGTVKFYDAAKGFGFIIPAAGGSGPQFGRG